MSRFNEDMRAAAMASAVATRDELEELRPGDLEALAERRQGGDERERVLDRIVVDPMASRALLGLRRLQC